VRITIREADMNWQHQQQQQLDSASLIASCDGHCCRPVVVAGN